MPIISIDYFDSEHKQNTAVRFHWELTEALKRKLMGPLNHTLNSTVNCDSFTAGNESIGMLLYFYFCHVSTFIGDITRIIL